MTDSEATKKRFLSRCTTNDTGCLLWVGYVDKKCGRPKASVEDKPQIVINWLWRIDKPLGLGHKLCNTCGNITCINVDHWSISPKLANSLDSRNAVSEMLECIDTPLSVNERWTALALLLAKWQQKGLLTEALNKVYKPIDAPYLDNPIIWDEAYPNSPKFSGIGIEKHQIYVLIDDRYNHVVYVGQTTNPENRLREHRHNKACNTGMLELKKNIDPYDIRMVIVDSANSFQWLEAERAWITYYRTLGKLLNS